MKLFIVLIIIIASLLNTSNMLNTMLDTVTGHHRVPTLKSLRTKSRSTLETFAGVVTSVRDEFLGNKSMLAQALV